MPIIAAAGPSAYWYLTRGTGTIALVLLTLSVAFGVANSRRVRTPALPRFVFDAVHRNVSLLAVAFVAVHILTSVLDSFASINLLDAVIPFASAYRPLWLGLGTVAFDLLLAVAITSMLRQRFGYRTWRLVHWVAYASWPVALVHGLGTGSDTRQGWMLVTVAACVIVVVAAVVSRATAGWSEHLGARASALDASALLPIGLLVWLPSGPLAHDWARRAGTPTALLGASSIQRASSSDVATSAFSAQVSGSIRQTSLGGGLAGVSISLDVAGQRLSRLSIDLRGRPIDDGGIRMTSSTVTLGTSSDSSLYQGRVTGLRGTNVSAVVRDGSGRTLHVWVALQLDSDAGAASGTVRASP